MDDIMNNETVEKSEDIIETEKHDQLYAQMLHQLENLMEEQTVSNNDIDDEIIDLKNENSCLKEEIALLKDKIELLERTQAEEELFVKPSQLQELMIEILPTFTEMKNEIIDRLEKSADELNKIRNESDDSFDSLEESIVECKKYFERYFKKLRSPFNNAGVKLIYLTLGEDPPSDVVVDDEMIETDKAELDGKVAKIKQFGCEITDNANNGRIIKVPSEVYIYQYRQDEQADGDETASTEIEETQQKLEDFFDDVLNVTDQPYDAILDSNKKLILQKPILLDNGKEKEELVSLGFGIPLNFESVISFGERKELSLAEISLGEKKIVFDEKISSKINLKRDDELLVSAKEVDTNTYELQFIIKEKNWISTSQRVIGAIDLKVIAEI